MGKTKPHKKRKAYLDVILMECTNVVPRRMSGGISSWFTGAPATQTDLNCFVRMNLTNQSRQFSIISNDRHPIWNEDATFTYYLVEENNLSLEIEVLDKVTGLLTTTDNLIYHGLVDLKELQMDEIVDKTIELTPVAADGQIIRQKRPSYCHIILQKSIHSANGMLNYLGTPLSEIPLRVDIGDVILINSSQFLTHTIKISTRSQWNHAALVAKLLKQKNLRLFEATSNGVCTYFLNSRLREYLEDDVVGIRRIALQRTDEMRDSLAKYIVEVEGRPYKYDVWHLMKSRMGTHTEEDMNTIFCSQLIGGALKRMDIIPTHVVSSNILPAHFDERNIIEEGDPLDKIIQPKLGKLMIFPSIGNGDPSIQENNEDNEIVDCIRITNAETEYDGNNRPHTLYTVQVTSENGLVWNVKRSYSQFQQLDEEMKYYFIHTPKLPPKKSADKMTSKMIQSRKKALEIYLEFLLDDSITRNAEPLMKFLNIDTIYDPILSDSEEIDFILEETKRKRKRKSKKSSKSKTEEF